MASNAGPNGDYTAIWRCIRSDGLHFISTSSNCEGETVEHVIGYTAPTRSTLMPRALTRCRHPPGSGAAEHYYHRLDGGCDAGDATEGHYGFVH